MVLRPRNRKCIVWKRLIIKTILSQCTPFPSNAITSKTPEDNFSELGLRYWPKYRSWSIVDWQVELTQSAWYYIYNPSSVTLSGFLRHQNQLMPCAWHELEGHKFISLWLLKCYPLYIKSISLSFYLSIYPYIYLVQIFCSSSCESDNKFSALQMEKYY